MTELRGSSGGRRRTIACVALAVWTAATVLAGPDPAAARDRAYCCWRIDVRVDGKFDAVLFGRASREAGAEFKEPGDVDGRSKFSWKAESRGLYNYREEGRERDPGLLSFGLDKSKRASKDRVQFTESGRECTYGPVEYTETADGRRYPTSQRCEPKRYPYPNGPTACERSMTRGWTSGGGIMQIVGFRGRRLIRTQLGGDAASTNSLRGTCNLPLHSPSYLNDHGMKGPTDFEWAPPQTTGARLRARRTFTLEPVRFTTDGTDPAFGRDQHLVEGAVTVKVKFTHFPRRRLRAERRALRALG